jgi:predicted permease
MPGSGIELLVMIVLIPCLLFAAVYPLIVNWHGIGLIVLVIILLALYVRHLRRIYRNARDS